MDLAAVEAEAVGLGHVLGVWRETVEGVVFAACAFGPCRAAVEVSDRGALGSAVSQRCALDRVKAEQMRGTPLDPHSAPVGGAPQSGPRSHYPHVALRPLPVAEARAEASPAFEVPPPVPADGGTRVGVGPAAAVDLPARVTADRPDATGTWTTFIMRLREKLGETQVEFARRFGLSGASCTNWEKGHNGVAPKFHDALRILGKANGLTLLAPVPDPPKPKVVAPGVLLNEREQHIVHIALTSMLGVSSNADYRAACERILDRLA